MKHLRHVRTHNLAVTSFCAAAMRNISQCDDSLRARQTRAIQQLLLLARLRIGNALDAILVHIVFSADLRAMSETNPHHSHRPVSDLH